MSDNIRNGGAGGAGKVWPWPTTNGVVGVTADEIKAQKASLVKDPTIQPIPETKATEFLNPSTSSEHLRLSPPAAANPMATPTGPVHDHFKVRSALDKAKGMAAQELHKFLNAPEFQSLPQEKQTQVKTSLAREQAMVTLLRGVQEMQESIYARVIGTSEA